jgi:hypothetical protein
MTTPDFSDLTPPQSELNEWEGFHFASALTLAARWGAYHGYNQARQLWPEPITDRPPTEEDADGESCVQVIRKGRWDWVSWPCAVANNYSWQRTPHWQPRQPTLQEQALKDLYDIKDLVARCGLGITEERSLMFTRLRRALERVGEGTE